MLLFVYDGVGRRAHPAAIHHPLPRTAGAVGLSGTSVTRYEVSWEACKSSVVWRGRLQRHASANGSATAAVAVAAAAAAAAAAAVQAAAVQAVRRKGIPDVKSVIQTKNTGQRTVELHCFQRTGDREGEILNVPFLQLKPTHVYYCLCFSFAFPSFIFNVLIKFCYYNAKCKSSKQLLSPNRGEGASNCQFDDGMIFVIHSSFTPLTSPLSSRPGSRKASRVDVFH